MTRTEYVAKLTKYLRKLPQKDYEEALEYFMEYFEEAGPENEAQVIAELGTPKEAAHEVISRLLDEKIIEEKSMKQVSNEDEILKIVTEVLDENPQSIVDFKNGKDRALGFMVGQVMKKSKGQANPKLASDLLTKELSKR